MKGQKGALQTTAWAQVSLIKASPQPAGCGGCCCGSEAKLFIWNVRETAPSFLIVNGLHALYWNPFSDTCLQVIRANPVASSLSVPPRLLISIDPPVRVWTAWTLRWESCIHPLCRHPPHSCSSLPKYSWAPLTLRSVAGASYILACLLSVASPQKALGSMRGGCTVVTWKMSAEVTERKCVLGGCASHIRQALQLFFRWKINIQIGSLQLLNRYFFRCGLDEPLLDFFPLLFCHNFVIPDPYHHYLD